MAPCIQTLCQLGKANCESISCDRDGNAYLAAETVIVLLATGGLRQVKIEPADGQVATVAISPDGRQLFVSTLASGIWQQELSAPAELSSAPAKHVVQWHDAQPTMSTMTATDNELWYWGDQNQALMVKAFSCMLCAVTCCMHGMHGKHA
jgi:hypothetical protein